MNATAAAAWTFPPEPASSREARRRVSAALEAVAVEAATASAALVVTELATNAVLHARTPFEVRLRFGSDTVRIEVHDGDGRPPVRRHFSDSATSGRGLRVVDELCEEWGVDTDPDGRGKTVWAVVSIEDGGFPGLDLSAAAW